MFGFWETSNNFGKTLPNAFAIDFPNLLFASLSFKAGVNKIVPLTPGKF
jgi:hypothetical protein